MAAISTIFSLDIYTVLFLGGRISSLVQSAQPDSLLSGDGDG